MIIVESWVNDGIPPNSLNSFTTFFLFYQKTSFSKSFHELDSSIEFDSNYSFFSKKFSRMIEGNYLKFQNIHTLLRKILVQSHQ